MTTFPYCKEVSLQHLILSLNNNMYGSSWSWSYGSWIYNYLCNQCLSAPQLWVRNRAHVEVYSIQHYVIKFDSELWQGTPVFSTNTTDCDDINEILLKVAWSAITLTLTHFVNGSGDFSFYVDVFYSLSPSILTEHDYMSNMAGVW